MFSERASKSVKAMKLLARKNFQRLHGYLSIFFLPLALIYIISGTLYLWLDVDTFEKEKITLYDLKPSSPHALADVEALLRAELGSRQYSIPRETLYLSDEESDKFKWRSGRSYRVEYRPSSSTKGKAYITIYQSTLYGRLINFHKGEGGVFFDVMGTAFALLLLISYLSGLFLALKLDSMRRGTWLSMLLGALVVAYLLIRL